MSVNKETVNEMVEMVGKEAVEEIFDALKETLLDLRGAVDGLDDQQVKDRSHSLKGSTSYLGTVEIHEAAVAADVACKKSDFASARNQLQNLCSMIDADMAELESTIAAAAE